MNTNLTEIVFILDRSGSMGTLVSDTIGGYNEFIKKQKELPGEAVLTTVLFDDKYELLHDRVNIKDVKDITHKEYYVRGTTALLDAIGKTINSVGGRFANMTENERPSKVIFVITTDGQENASKEFNLTRINEMITHQTDKYSWQFIFLGANIDAVSVGNSLGITMSANYSADSGGTRSLYSTISNATESYRSSGNIGSDWDKDLQ